MKGELYITHYSFSFLRYKNALLQLLTEVIIIIIIVSGCNPCHIEGKPYRQDAA